MRVKLLKKHMPASHSRFLKKGTELRVDNAIGREWIEKGIAVEFDGVTKEEIQTIDAMIEDLEEKPIKKVTPKNKDKK